MVSGSSLSKYEPMVIHGYIIVDQLGTRILPLIARGIVHFPTLLDFLGVGHVGLLSAPLRSNMVSSAQRSIDLPRLTQPSSACLSVAICGLVRLGRPWRSKPQAQDPVITCKTFPDMQNLPMCPEL